MIHGDKVLEVLRSKYERMPIVEFASLHNTRPGDVLLATGNGANNQPHILRVLAPWQEELKVATIYPECSACQPQECRHPHIMPYGSLLRTKVLTRGEHAKAETAKGA